MPIPDIMVKLDRVVLAFSAILILLGSALMWQNCAGFTDSKLDERETTYDIFVYVFALFCIAAMVLGEQTPAERVAHFLLIGLLARMVSNGNMTTWWQLNILRAAVHDEEEKFSGAGLSTAFQSRNEQVFGGMLIAHLGVLAGYLGALPWGNLKNQKVMPAVVLAVLGFLLGWIGSIILWNTNATAVLTTGNLPDLIAYIITMCNSGVSLVLGFVVLVGILLDCPEAVTGGAVILASGVAHGGW